MLFFLCDSTRVLSRLDGSGATPEIKLRLWQLYCLCTYMPLNPNRNNCVALAWNMFQSTKSLADATSYIKLVWSQDELKILLELLDLVFTKKVYPESWSSTNVSPSVVATTTTIQNFALAYFGASLPTFTKSCLASSSPQASVSFSVKGSLSITIWSFPFTSYSPRLGPTTGWAASPWKLYISRGKPAFPLGIVQSSLTACWAPGLCNPLWQPVGLQDCAVILANPPSRIYTNFPSSRLFSPVFVQI